MEKYELTEKKVFSYMEKYHMIAPGDKIVLGVSGGADSVCLLFLLLEYAKKVPLSFAVVHVNHGIRPDAGEDADYVRELCETYNLPFYLVEEDVCAKAHREKCSEEDAGRRVRYKAFENKATEVGATRIAVAHNCDDNAETMLMHLFRGTGLSGLSGIAPVRGNIIRPLLCLRRREIEEYLQERDISWRNDSTNNSDDYTRNRIRHNIMPRAEIEVAPGAPVRMRKTAELLRETEDFLEQETEAALKRCLDAGSRCAETGPGKFTFAMEQGDLAQRVILCRDSFLTLHPAIQKRILLKLAKELSPTGKDISAIHVEDMLKIICGEGNRSANLPFGIIVRRQYDKVILEKGVIPMKPEFIRKEDHPVASLSIKVDTEKDAVYDLGACGKLEISHIFQENYQEVPTNQYTKWFDYDKINGYLEIRTRRQGDYLTIRDGAGGSRHKVLKDYMIAEKIPKELRDKIPVLAVGSHVLWLMGYRMSEDFKVSENTKQVIQAKLITKERSEQKAEEKNGRAD